MQAQTKQRLDFLELVLWEVVLIAPLERMATLHATNELQLS